MAVLDDVLVHISIGAGVIKAESGLHESDVVDIGFDFCLSRAAGPGEADRQRVEVVNVLVVQ
ncbi:hypothetical protein ACIQ9P_09315 [Kitasatospora sp. NPDC094019]|uniref:hypothetical protein n=1 Tax=Kitasatospora sp. NPDC094019 TaxID=3364091 RepID=UPI0038141869